MTYQCLFTTFSNYKFSILFIIEYLNVSNRANVDVMPLNWDRRNINRDLFWLYYLVVARVL